MNMSKYSQIYPYHPNRHAAYIFNYVILAFSLSLHSERRYVYFHFFLLLFASSIAPKHSWCFSFLRVKEWGSKQEEHCVVGDETFCGLVKFWRAYFHHWNTHLPQLLLFNIFITWPKLLRRLISVEHEMILYFTQLKFQN